MTDNMSIYRIVSIYILTQIYCDSRMIRKI